MRIVRVLVVALVVAACGGNGGGVALQPDAGEDAGIEATAETGDRGGEDAGDLEGDPGWPEELREVATEVDAGADQGGEETEDADAGLPDTTDPCQVAPFAFGCPCGKDAECKDGYCIQAWNGKVCTSTCVEECPDGFTCALVGGSCPDCQYLCQPLFAYLCRPCLTNGDCATEGVASSDLCVDLGAEGKFCGAACSGVVSCPEGYSCKYADVAGGLKSYQCVPDAETCDCSELAVAQGAKTSCFVENEAGKCQGTRQCEADGLSDCNAPVPAPEVCNGADDNCNGTVDEGMGGKECTVKNQFGQCPGTELCLGGVTMCDAADPAPEICDGMDNNCDGMTDEGSLDTDQDGKANCLDNDDDNDLVVDELDNCPLAYNADQKDADFDQLGNACDLDDDNDGVADETDCQPLDKNSFPAAAEVCDGKDNDCDLWVDEGTCSDGNPCTDDVCDPSAGCKNPPNEASCEDGNPCTGGDQCAEGKCKPGVNVCFCQKDADCAALGFVGGCMGKLYCDLNAAPTVCKLDPSQATPCPPAQGACQASACNPATGACVTTAAADGTVCDDGNACTAGDKCASGKCVSGQNLCQCQVDADCAPFEDGDKCNGTLYCDKTQMFPACKLKADSVVKCGPAAGACKMNVCDPGTGKCGLANAADMNGCDDQDKCSIGDHCSKGQCVAQAFLECDDDNQCTKDACDPDVGCYYASLNNVPCSDGDLCTAGDTCKQGLCVPGGKVGCDDGNECTKDACDPVLGCSFTPVAGACDDGNACTSGDACANGKCKGGSGLACDDGNACTYDVCDPTAGCQHTPQDVPCSDGNACTVVDACQAGKCVGSGTPDCEDNNLCTDDSCATKTGCVHSFNSKPCDDGSKCSVGDQCGGGKCIPGPAPDCNDKDPCTDDSCDPATGCVHKVNTDFNTDELNCGLCGHICPEFTVCQGGSCLLLPGRACNGNAECLSGYCRLDFDGVGQFCAQDAVSCVYALAGTTATQVSPGAKMCGGGTASKSCSAGVWGNQVTCSAAGCNGTIYSAAQSCVDGDGCTPAQPQTTECTPYGCTAQGCKNSCATNADCAPNYQCANNKCSQGPINQPGSIKVGSQFYGDDIAGWSQCAGWTNTTDWDILTTNWIQSCANSNGKQLRFRLYNAQKQVMFDETFPGWTASEMSNNLPGCDDNGYGTCGKTGASGKALLIYKPNNSNGGCHGDDNSSGAVRISTSTNGNNMGNNYIFLGGKRYDGGYRNHNNGTSPDSEIRWMNGGTWDGCQNDGRVSGWSIAVYVQN